MKTLLHAIPIDIVEIIIVKSDNYNLFLKLQDFLVKLKEQSRLSRINDKLTKTYNINNSISYKLNNDLHKEYNKPSQIHTKFPGYEYHNHGKLNRANDNPTSIYMFSKYWRVNDIQHRDDDLPRYLDRDETQKWMKNGEQIRNNNLPNLINSRDGRSFNGVYEDMFNYLL